MIMRYDKIRRRMRFENVSCSVQRMLPSYLLSKTLKIMIYKTTVVPVVLYWYGTWAEHKKSVRKNIQT
jgi:hypothetical protein